MLAPDGELVSAGSPAVRDGVVALIHGLTHTLGFRPLSDDAWLRLLDGSANGLLLEGSGRSAGWADVVARDDGWHLEIAAIDDDRTEQALSAAVGAARAARAPRLSWLVLAADERSDRLAESHGFVPGRGIHQMRAALPHRGDAATVPTRPFEVGRDEAEWLGVNARAFAAHPEQGGWTLDDLRRREAAAWFDPAGFLLHERDGRIAAFCWTKIHEPETAGSPRLGEIYVIAVDPTMHGLGLGRALTAAGLRSLHDRGITEGMLHVDVDNVAAVTLYESMGFTVHHTDRIYLRPFDTEDLP